jgi:hypothetical protein
MVSTSTVKNWTIAVKNGQRHLFGECYGRLGLRDGDPIRSNAIVGTIEVGIVRTASGSTYILDGPACRDFHAWHAAQVAPFRLATPGFEPVGAPAITEVD